MKALLFLPFTFAAGAEGFALFTPYLIGVLAVIYLGRRYRSTRRSLSAFRLEAAPAAEMIPAAHPVL